MKGQQRKEDIREILQMKDDSIKLEPRPSPSASSSLVDLHEYSLEVDLL